MLSSVKMQLTVNATVIKRTMCAALVAQTPGSGKVDPCHVIPYSRRHVRWQSGDGGGEWQTILVILKSGPCVLVPAQADISFALVFVHLRSAACVIICSVV